MDHAALAYPAIPIDLFGSKKHAGLDRGELGFADSGGNIVFRAKRQFSKPESGTHHSKRMLLLDAARNPIFSIYRDRNRSWKVFKLGEGEEKQVICTAGRTRKSLIRTEFDVFLSSESSEDSTASLKMKGFAFQKSCTIYRGDSIVAQTSLLYKLRQIYVSRRKFRVTIYPASVDHALIAALVVMYLDG